jgi:hypothetical protein
MPRKKFTDTQIALVVKELEGGARASDLSRKLGGIVNLFAGTYSQTESEAILPHFSLKQPNLES